MCITEKFTIDQVVFRDFDFPSYIYAGQAISQFALQDYEVKFSQYPSFYSFRSGDSQLLAMQSS